MEYIYLDYLNQNFIRTFDEERPNTNRYAPYLYAGMLFNVSMAWLDRDCAEEIPALADTIVNAIYFAS